MTTQQHTAAGWTGREGVDDRANQFHYYRLTPDNRFLFGGYNVIYHFGKRIEKRYDKRPESFRTLAEHSFQTFPQLSGLRFTHAWGGVIGSSTRFFPSFGRARGGRVVHIAGYTGLGVAMTRFAAGAALDILSGHPSELTNCDSPGRCRYPSHPNPDLARGHTDPAFLATADRRQGRRNLWLRALDAAGIGFNS